MLEWFTSRQCAKALGFWRNILLWWQREDSNLSRFAGVSAEGACRRNPERARRAEGPGALVAAGGLEPPTYGL
jgi:hypothetical protein